MLTPLKYELFNKYLLNKYKLLKLFLKLSLLLLWLHMLTCVIVYTWRPEDRCLDGFLLPLGAL